VLVQSDREPDWGWLAESSHYLLPGFHPNPASKAFESVFRPGQCLYFRLRANPTVKRKFPGQDKSKRVGLYKEAEQRGWLARKAEQSGFIILDVSVTSEGPIGGKTKIRHDLNLIAVRFEGQLQVTDPVTFSDTLERGIGSGKGLGFGLLSLAQG
jgi:CRISPR system Cascade subunit CasE